MIAAAAILAVPTISLAQTDTRPVVVVFRFGNNSLGSGRADYDGMATGIQDLLITDLASNGKIRLVDREHLNEVLAEQNLAKTGQIDPQTAVKVGKIFGAQYAITRGFMSDGQGGAVMTARTIDIETTQIINPNSVRGKTNNPLGLIADLSGKVSGNMNLTPKAGVGQSGAPGGAASKDSTRKPQSNSVEYYARQVTPAVEQKTLNSGLDAAGFRLYNNALDAVDAKDKAKAKDLFKQVVTKYPDFEPAKAQLAKLS